MRVYRGIEQQTPEWFALKAGIPSASRAGRVITAKTGALSAQAEGYINELLAERVGIFEDTFEGTAHTDNGNRREAEARELVCMTLDCDLEQVAFVTTDDGLLGCSPDGINVEGKYGAEIKCPMAKTHIGYLRYGQLPDSYKQQVHMSMAVTGFKRWHFASYYPGLEPLLITAEWDDYTDKVKKALAQFSKRLEAEALRLGITKQQLQEAA